MQRKFVRRVRCWLGALALMSAMPGWGGDFDLLPGQECLVTTWGANEGLQVNSITDLAQTPEGYLWAGTLLSGLVRFDGVRFVSFNSHNTPELPTMGLRRLMVDRSGLLWISAYAGALTTWSQQGFSLVLTNAGRLDNLLWSRPGQVIFLNAKRQILAGKKSPAGWQWTTTELPGLLPRALPCADVDGRIWYLRSEHEIGVWQDGKVETLTLPPGLDNKRIVTIINDDMGDIWAGTDRGLFKWETDHFVNLTPPEDGEKIHVRRLVLAGSSFWVHDFNHLRRFGNGKWLAEAEGWNTDFAAASFRIWVGDARGGLWLASDELGLIHVQADGTILKISTRDGLPSNAVRCLAFDRGGDAWVGYDHGGVVRVSPRLFKVIGREQGLREPLVNSVCEDTNGAVWIGTAGKIISRFQRGECSNFSLALPRNSRNTVVTVDAANRVWAGAQGGGLLRFTNGQFVQTVSPTQLPGDVRQLLPSRDGRLWVGTLDAVFVVENGKVAKVFDPQSTENRPAALAETSDGNIWAGTFKQLLRWDGNKFIPQRLPDQKSFGRIWSLCPAPDGSLWIGTSQGGVLHWQDGKFNGLTTSNGLRSDCVAQVQLARNGDLWLVTAAGIERIESSALARYERGDLAIVPVSQYGHSDGLASIGGSIEYQPNCWRGRGGVLWFAMANDVAGVDADAVRADALPPTVVMEEMQLNQARIWPSNPAEVFAVDALAATAPPTREIPEVVVPPGRHDLQFRFTGLSSRAPQLLQFKYRLEGAEKDWHLADGERTALYHYLPPGKYAFRVKAANSDDVWNEGSASLRVVLQPFFYQTAAFQWTMGLAAAAGLGLTVWKISRRRMRRRLELLAHQRELEQNRARIAKDVHDEIGAKLTRISYMSELAKQEDAPAEKIQMRIDAIAETSRDLLQSLDEIVWAVNPQNDTLEHLATYLSHYAHEYFQGTAVDCAVEMPSRLPETPVSSEARHNLFLAFEESLTNVLKHAAARHVRIEMKLHPQEFEISITDDGRGLPAKHVGNSAQPDADGLRNMKHRLAQIGGSCAIHSHEGRGTIIRLVIPLKSAKLNTTIS